MYGNKSDLTLFLITTTGIIVLLAFTILTTSYLYQRKHLIYLQNLDAIKLDNEKNFLSVQLEIQESTFQRISREIHDNISLSLTLAKLNLNTIDWTDTSNAELQINSCLEILSQTIVNLNDMSKSLGIETVNQL